MNTVVLLSLSHIRKKKLQNGLVMILILLSTLLIGTAATIILNTGDIFTKLHSKTEGSHQIVILDQGFHDPQKVYQWWKEEQDVKTSALLPYKSITEIYHEGKGILNVYLDMINTPEQPFDVDRLIMVDGNETLVPQKGTVWIPTSLAYPNGIRLGDQLQFGTGPNQLTVEVSGIVIDLPYCAPFTNGMRIWMNSYDYTTIKVPKATEKYMFGLRYDDYNQRSAYWKEFEEFLGTPYLENVKNFENISGFYLIMNQIIGAIMIFLGIVMILIALFTMKFTIADAILSDYKSIGIIKSLGLASGKLIQVYILQFFILAVVAIFGGTAASIVISKSIIESTLSYIRNNDTLLSIQRVWVSGLVGFIVLLAVILFVYMQVRKVKWIQPAQAIRFGMSENQNSKITKHMAGNGLLKISLERYPVLFVIGCRNLLKNKKSSILMIALTIMTSAVMVFGFIFLYSLLNIQRNAPLWGYDASHISVTIYNQSTLSLTDLEEDMKSDERIKNINRYSGTIGIFPLGEQSVANGNLSFNINMDVIDGSFDELGCVVIKGRNPTNQNEIALGVNAAVQLGKEVGDICEVYIKGEKQALTISGIYQSIANMSNSARITADVMKKNNTYYNQVETYFINLKDVNKSDEFVTNLNSKYKDGLTAVTQKTLIDGVFSEVIGLLIYPMLIIGLLFTVVTFIIIYGTCRINLQKDSKCYGIYRSLGLATNQIRLAVAGGVVGMAVIGSVIGMFTGIFGIPLLMEKVLVNYGIVKLPIMINSIGVLSAVVLTIVVAGIGSWLSSASIRKTSPRILVIE